MTITGKKSKLVLPIMLANIGVIATSLILGCVSWFSLTNKFNPVDLRSSVLTSYFDSRDSSHPSDGSEENPFVITKPQHLYNLIGLHKSDKLFNIEGENIMFWEAGFYFEFGKDMFDIAGREIAVTGSTPDGDKEFYNYDDGGVLLPGQTNYLNMNYYSGDNALSPIGTASHPFRGHIKGNNLTVTNLHITGIGCADIGIFGYVSEEATIENLYFDGIDIDVRQVDLNEYNSIYHTDTHTKANVGYIGGHVEANDSFQDVYVNNCKIRNSQGTQVGINNDYGYFGATDFGLGNPVATGDGFSYSFNPDKTYEYLEENYNSIKNSQLVLRNDFAPATGTFGTSMSQSSSGGNHYTLEGSVGDSTAQHNYALSKIGFEEGDAVQNVWYKEGSSYKSPNTRTQVMDDEPNVIGSFAYYNGQTWDYYLNTANDTECGANFLANTLFFTTTRPDLTKEIWTWYWSGSYPKRYLRHNNNGGKGRIDDVQYDGNNGIYLAFMDYPGQPDNRDSEYIHGNYIRSDANRTVYICDFRSESRPVKYLFVSNDNNKTLKWGEYQDAVGENSLGCAFHMNGSLGAVMSIKVGIEKYVLCWDGSKIVARPEGQGSPAYFCLGGAGCNDTNLKSDSFNLVTRASDLKDGDEVAFAYGLNPQNGGVEVMSAKQGTYNRKGISNQTTNSGGVAQMMNNNEFGHFTVRKNTSDNTWSFYDETNDGYLSATSSFSDTMQLAEYFNNNSHFTLNFNSNSAALLEATGVSTHNKLRYDVENAVFSCFEDGKQPVYIFKRVANGLRDRVFDVQGCDYGTYGNFGGVRKNILPMYWSTPGAEALTKMTRFVEGPDAIGDFNFNADGYESTTIVEMSSGSSGGGEETWARCMDEGDLTVGAEYIIATYNNTFCGTAGPVTSGGYMQEVTGTTFGSNGKVIVNPDPNATIFLLRAGEEEGTYSFETGGQYLGTTGMGNLNLDGDGVTDWTINFASNFYVDIKSTTTSNGHIAYGFASTETTPAVPNRFTTMLQGKEILLYKKTTEMDKGTFISDEISATLDPQWNADVIDVIGNASFYEDGMTLSPTTTFKSLKYNEDNHVGTGRVGAKYYNNFNCSDALTIKVKNVGSLDFGTITIYGEGESPTFMKGSELEEGTQYVAFDDALIRCENESKVQGKFQYTLSLNIYNIYNLAYCALDGSGHILAGYDNTGGMNAPDQDDFIGFDTKDEDGERILDNFVLALGNTGDSSCKITKVDYSYKAAVGNMINFGKVGYRSAIYEGGETDELGNNVKKDSLVTGPVMNFEYDLPAGGAYMLIGVEYTFDASYQKYVYSITIKSSVALTVYIFNYDAQRELVKINGVLRAGAYTAYPVTAVEPPIGGWTK